MSDELTNLELKPEVLLSSIQGEIN